MSDIPNTRAEAVSKVAEMTARDLIRAIQSRGYAQPGMTGTDALAARRLAQDAASLEAGAMTAATETTKSSMAKLQKAIGGPSAAHEEIRKLLTAVQAAHEQALKDVVTAAKQVGYLNRQADERAGPGAHAILKEGASLGIATLMNKVALTAAKPLRVVVVAVPQHNLDSGFSTSAMVEIRTEKGWSDEKAAFDKYALDTRAQLNEWAHEALDKIVFATGKPMSGYIAIPSNNELFEGDADVLKAFSVAPPAELGAAPAARKATQQDNSIQPSPAPTTAPVRQAPRGQESMGMR